MNWQKTPIRWALATTLWGVLVIGGTVAMIGYSNTAGDNGKPPEHWPKQSQILFSGSKPALVMFVHPRCPCSRASLGELQILLAQFPGKLDMHVVFLKPAGTVTNWEKTDLWRTAASTPGVRVHSDISGAEALLFHAETSGQTLLYDQNGNLQFQGGITGGRGHAGDNPGRSAIGDFLRGGSLVDTKTPVYGCALFESHCTKGDATCKP